MNNYCENILMDPDWPVNPLKTVICALCKSAIPFVNRNPERFFRHLLADHSAYFNLNLLLEVSLLQPRRSGDYMEAPSPPHKTAAPLQSHDHARLPVEIKDSIDEVKVLKESGGIGTGQANQDAGEFDLSFLINNIVEADPLAPSPTPIPASSDGETVGNFNIPVTTSFLTELAPNSSSFFVPSMCKSKGGVALFKPTVPSIQTDFDALDPISIVPREPSSKKTRQTFGPTSVQQQPTPGPGSVPDNPNKHLVPEDLQERIIKQNPNREIKFTLSQRMNTQMVVDDYLLKKKKGPLISRGGRVINWKCVNDSCQYTAVTWEGQLQDTSRHHNHAAQPELYIKKQARVKIRENIANEIQMSNVYYEDRPVSNVVQDVVNETNSEVRDMIGSIDALKQAARRFNRKLQNKDPKPLSSQEYNHNQFGSSPNLYVGNFSNYEIVGELPENLKLSLTIPSSGVRMDIPHVTVSKVDASFSNIKRGYNELGVSVPVVVSDNHQTCPGASEKDNIEELLEASPTKQDRLADELISDC